ncbi:armadillo-type protein [Xylaria bambusicola]|uniref:armadillo-type protein n=1 Tax=Xylaria bambusicola TaxID=326684 RepID=UPI002007A5D8|nr:armadillo-type protein [Xylaria bambusicola]KAI0521888.1 armadillo-type protein [Xylaria bambusicola]
MDFLKSAVASAIAAQGPPFPYSFGDKVDIDSSIWTLYNGTRRADGSNCSIFSFDVTANKSRLPLAKNALKKLRTMRHPGVIKVLDAVETDSYIYIATERLVPLRWHVKRKSLNPETIKWGLYSIARTVKFINEEGSSIHGSLRVASIYTSESGEWKLGGFEVLSNVKDDDAIIYTYGSLVPDSSRFTPPELAQSGWDAIKKSPHSAVDSYNFGTTIYEVFNGDFSGQYPAGQTKGIPPTMHVGYKRLVNANPKARITVGAFFEQGRRSGGFFDSPLIKLTEGIDNLDVKSETERAEFLDDLDQLTDDFPEDFFKMKVLPELLKSVEFGGGGPKAFGVVMKIAAKLPNDDFEARVQPVVVRLFGNPDRAIRVCLLENLPLMIDRLPQKVVNDKIFPNMVSGFTDLAPLVREQTLKSVLVVIHKLSDRIINGELLKYLAKTANDEQPGIRTNTTICLGKIAKNLGTSNRAKVLIAAFTRSLRDPFVHARNAALMALAATGEYFTEEDCASRILPVICPSLIDKEKLVRDQANKTVDIYLQRIRKAAASMPDTVIPPSQTADGTGPRMSTPQPSEASSWAGWAISSFTNKLSAVSGEMQTANGTTTPQPTSPSAGSESKRIASTSSASALHRQAVKSPSPAPLSRNSTTSAPDAYFKDPLPIEDDDAGDAWGDMGDMNDDDTADAWGEPSDNTTDAWSNTTITTPATTTTTSKLAKKTPAVSSKPFDDGSEPDFAGWLAAQAQKKNPGIGKPLPKGLAKSSSGAAKKPLASRPASASTKSKKIDLKPKDTGGDEDGWGDGW